MSWLLQVAAVALLTVLADVVLPSGQINKYVKGMMAILLLIVLVSPLVGGYISQGFDLVATSLSLIKNALGAYAMILTVAVVLRPLVKVLLLTVGLKLVAGLIQPVSDQRMASMVGSVADCMRSLTAATAGVGFAFLVTMLQVMSSTTMVL